MAKQRDDLVICARKTQAMQTEHGRIYVRNGRFEEWLGDLTAHVERLEAERS
jgi:hypothetical protein